MTAGDIVTIVVLLRLLRRLRIPERWALIYALNPLLIDSFAQRGQMDALMLPFLVAAPLLLARGKLFGAGAALAAGALVKPVPLLALPILLASDPRTRLAPGAPEVRRGGTGTSRLLLGAAIVLLVGSLPWIGAGLTALRGFKLFAVEWRTNASMFALVEAAANARVAPVVSMCGVLVAVGCCMLAARRCGKGSEASVGKLRHVTASMCAALLALLLLSPAVFPWYLTWLLPFTPVLMAQRGWRGMGEAVLCWSATVLLWYLRFMAYTPLAQTRWSEVAQWVYVASHWMPEPWRLLEYAPVFILLARCWVRGRTLRTVET
jgi:hypothetical protein